MPTVLGFSPTAQVSAANRDPLRERREPGTTGGARRAGDWSRRGAAPTGAN